MSTFGETWEERTTKIVLDAIAASTHFQIEKEKIRLHDRVSSILDSLEVMECRIEIEDQINRLPDIQDKADIHVHDTEFDPETTVKDIIDLYARILENLQF